MYKFKKKEDNQLYDRYITHLSRKEIEEGKYLDERRREFDLIIKIGASVYADSQLQDIASFSYEMDMGEEDYPIGKSPYKTLKVTIRNNITKLDGSSSWGAGQYVEPTIRLKVGKGGNEYLDVPYGKYRIEKVERNIAQTVLTCYDELYFMDRDKCKFEEKYTEYGGNSSIQNILDLVCDKYNVGYEASDFGNLLDDIMPAPIKYKDIGDYMDDVIIEDPGDDFPGDDDPIEDDYPPDEGGEPSDDDDGTGDGCTCPDCKCHDDEPIDTEDSDLRCLDQLKDRYWDADKRYWQDYKGWDMSKLGGGIFKENNLLAKKKFRYVVKPNSNSSVYHENGNVLEFESTIYLMLQAKNSDDGLWYDIENMDGLLCFDTDRNFDIDIPIPDISLESINARCVSLKITKKDDILGPFLAGLGFGTVCNVSPTNKIKIGSVDLSFSTNNDVEYFTIDGSYVVNKDKSAFGVYSKFKEIGDTIYLPIDINANNNGSSVFQHSQGWYAESEIEIGTPFRSEGSVHTILFEIEDFSAKYATEYGKEFETFIEDEIVGRTLLEFELCAYGKDRLREDEYQWLLTHLYVDSPTEDYYENNRLYSRENDATTEECSGEPDIYQQDSYDGNMSQLTIWGAFYSVAIYGARNDTTVMYGIPVGTLGGPEHQGYRPAPVESTKPSENEDIIEVKTYTISEAASRTKSMSYDSNNNLIVTLSDEESTETTEGRVRDTTPQTIGQDMTHAELLRYVAGYCGGNMILDHNNNLRLIKLNKGGDDYFDKYIPQDQYAEPALDDCDKAATLIGLVIERSEMEADTLMSPEFGLPVPGREGYIISTKNPFMNQTRLDQILDEMGQIKYYPINTTVLGDPRLSLGDILKFDDFYFRREEEGFGYTDIQILREGYYPIMKLSGTFDNTVGMHIEATCTDGASRTDEYKGTLTERVDNLNNDINSVADTVTKVSTDVEQMKILVAYINKLFAIEVNSDNIVTGTINTKYVKVRSDEDNAKGLFIDGDSISFIDNNNNQRINLGPDENGEYRIKLANSSGKTRTFRVNEPSNEETNNGNSNENTGNNTETPSTMSLRDESSNVDLLEQIARLEARIQELENKLNEE